jgi:hypothetical protein
MQAAGATDFLLDANGLYFDGSAALSSGRGHRIYCRQDSNGQYYTRVYQ